ncbi:hypothetical protein JTB14_004448 [Gonioctena quinquepunctata]|nr:hypothetical protein JTB14_004448 [Gonioctena quinquepunctata]
MSAFLQPRENQLSTEAASEASLVTKNPWMIEARNRHIKSINEFLVETNPVQHVLNSVYFYQIVGSLSIDSEKTLLCKVPQRNKPEQCMQELIWKII